MTKADEYRTKLHGLDQWDAYLLKESGLPGPQGNIELAQQRCTLDHEGEFEAGPAGSDGCRVGQAMARQNRRLSAPKRDPTMAELR